MNIDNKNNSADNNHNYSPQTNKPIDEPIDAEIIAETPNNSSAVDEDENIINLTYYPVLEQNQANQLEKDDSLSSWVEQGLTPLSTPWGLGSLSLILLSNLAIAGVQLWKLYEPPQTSPTATLQVDPTPSRLSIPNSLNIARKSPNKVIVDGLSTVSNPSTPSQSPQQQPKPSPIASAPTQKVVNVNQPLSLTNAILPPSLQPQTPPHYQQSVTPLKVPQPPKTTPIPIAKIPRPLPSAIQPPPPPIPKQLVSQDEQVRQTMQQQLQPGMSPSVPPSPQPSTVPSMTIQPPPPPTNNQPVSQDKQVRQTMQQKLQPGMSPSVPPSPQPSTVPSITIQPPSPPTNNQPVSQDEQVRQTIKQQLTMEENNQNNIPLGFNHKTRLEMQNGLNELPSQLLPQQVNYLEQLQQREVLDSQTSPGTTIK